MAVKKMRAKTKKNIVKRIKVTNGGDPKKGKLIIGRNNLNHRLIKKSRERKLRGARDTVLSKVHDKFKKFLTK